jgi:hypothetical protein
VYSGKKGGLLSVFWFVVFMAGPVFEVFAYAALLSVFLAFVPFLELLVVY